MANSASPEEAMIFKRSRKDGVFASSSASWAIPKMPFMGVRTSWLIMAMKSPFARLAASSSAMRRRSLTVRIIYRVNPTNSSGVPAKAKSNCQSDRSHCRIISGSLTLATTATG